MITIVTHNGRFHTDDVFAVASLRLLLGDKDINIIRTRDKKEIEKGDYVIDVGGRHNPDKNLFDHHQLGGAGERKNKILYASFGLVWQKYGGQICASGEVAERIDQKLVQGVDASDNGIDIATPLFDGVHSYTTHNIIGLFAPTYKEKNISNDTEFSKAVEWAKQTLKREIAKTTDFIEAEDKVRQEYKTQEDRQIVVFANKKDYERPTIIKSALQDYPEPIYIVLYGKENDDWKIFGMNKDKNTFETKKLLPKEWRGLRDEDLVKVSGVEDAIFCHSAGFMCVAKSMEGAVKMAELALANNPPPVYDGINKI